MPVVWSKYLHAYAIDDDAQIMYRNIGISSIAKCQHTFCVSAWSMFSEFTVECVFPLFWKKKTFSQKVTQHNSLNNHLWVSHEQFLRSRVVGINWFVLSTSHNKPNCLIILPSLHKQLHRPSVNTQRFKTTASTNVIDNDQTVYLEPRWLMYVTAQTQLKRSIRDFRQWLNTHVHRELL